jgi:hypothetical protein
MFLKLISEHIGAICLLNSMSALISSHQGTTGSKIDGMDNKGFR